LTTADTEAAQAQPKARARRKDKGAARRRGPVENFTFSVALPAVGFYVLICVIVFATLHLMTGEINRIDGDRGRKALEGAVGSLVQQLGGQASDEATWTEAYLNTYVALNPAWLDTTWGAGARTDGPYDTALVTDPKGQILFGEASSGPVTGTIADHFSGTPEMLVGLDEGIAATGDSTSVAGFAERGDTVSALAVAVIHGTNGQRTTAPAERRLLWLAKHVDADALKAIAHHYQIPVPHFLTGRPELGEEVMPLRDTAGRSVGELVWRPLRPGDAAFTHAVSIASIVLLIVGALLFVMLTAFRRNVERRAEAEERDWIGARYDAATGLLNRFGLEEMLTKLAPKRGKLNVSIAFIEFEGLKEIIGSYGHETAEALLDRLADIIDEKIEKKAQIARLGPDEFALCRTGEDAGGIIRNFARTVIECVSDAIPVNNLRLKLGASVGVAEAEVTAKNVQKPFLMAAAALQRARETGGNQVIEFEDGIEESRQNRLAMQADIRRGLDADEFDLAYQPIFDFGTQRMLGVEALLRWPRRAGGPMPPGEFIPAAEASGLIEELGLFVLRKACREIAPFPDLKLSVNISTVQLRSPSLPAQVDGALASARLPPRRLQLEITESFLLAQPERAKVVIEGLRRRGIAIALDDFGTGYSSVGYLRQFSCDRVKLDRSLVSDVDQDPAKAALVESTLVFAFAMGLAVTAEGVERREEAALLTRLGCREFQGYLLSRPISLEQLSKLLEHQPPMQEAS
jgi:diguanylate cyclase (GGDEF)-like protein